MWVRVTPKLLAALDEHPYLELSDLEGALCQPNLANPLAGSESDAAAATGQASAVSAETPAGRGGAQSSDQHMPCGTSDGHDSPGGGVDNTLLLLPGPSAGMGPIAFRVSSIRQF